MYCSHELSNFIFALRIRLGYCKSSISYQTYLLFQAEPSGHEDDDILILDVDEDLLKEMDSLLKDLIL
jgi:hypothetical protein